MITFVGFVAATLTAFAFLPQVFKTWRSRSAADLSLSMLLTQTSGVALWIVYGVSIRSIPIIAANIINLAMTLMLLAFKLTNASAATSRSARPGV